MRATSAADQAVCEQMTNSILQTIGVAEAARLLDQYCDPAGKNAWPLYDEDPSPGTLCGADLTAPALLSYPIKRKYLDEFGRQDPNPETGEERNPYRRLYDCMERFVHLPAEHTFASVSLPVGDSSQHDRVPRDWLAFSDCLSEVQRCEGLWSTAVTKILHRKRPDLVPINDSLLRDFYGTGPNYGPLFASIHSELNHRETGQLLNDLASAYTTPCGRSMTSLRALDIIVWTFMKETGGTATS